MPRTPTPPSPTNPYIAAALLNGTTDDNDIATITRSSAADVEAIPDAILDPSPETTIHPKGNLLLVVGPSTRQRSLLVQAETIEHFGPLWQELIKDSNRERLLSTRRTAYLPADDADMMLVVMYLSHSWHLGKVPRELSFPQLLAMTRICDKYDMNTQVSPFARRWIVPHQEMLLSPGREQWLFVARQFGLERHYVTLANHLVLGCWTEGGRTLFTPGRGEKLEGLVPEGALGGFFLLLPLPLRSISVLGRGVVFSSFTSFFPVHGGGFGVMNTNTTTQSKSDGSASKRCPRSSKSSTSTSTVSKTATRVAPRFIHRQMTTTTTMQMQTRCSNPSALCARTATTAN